MCNGRLVCGNGRSGKYKLSGHPPLTYHIARSIPKSGCKLPFVNQPRHLTFKYHFRIGLCKHQIGSQQSRVVQEYTTCSCLLSRGCLSAPFRSLNEDCPCCLQLFMKRFIRYSFLVFFTHTILTIFHVAKIMINFLMYKHLCIIFLQLANFCSYSWRFFIPIVGR